MALTTEQMQHILVDLQIGREPPREVGLEADTFREKLRPEIEEIRRRGWVVDVPAEWES